MDGNLHTSRLCLLDIMDVAAAGLKVRQRRQALDLRELHDDGGAVENGVITYVLRRQAGTGPLPALLALFGPVTPRVEAVPVVPGLPASAFPRNEFLIHGLRETRKMIYEASNQKEHDDEAGVAN
jgi:hypothetical protein